MSKSQKCGQCHQAISSGTPIQLTVDTFSKQLERNDIRVLVDFWAPWCSPCLMMAPEFEQAAKQIEPRLRFAKINTETEQGLGAQFSIRSIPTMKLFLHGKEIANQSAAMSAKDIIGWVNIVAPSPQ